MNRIAHIAIDNYRLFDRMALGRVGRVNLLVGPNGSGKSTILDAVEACYLAPPLGQSLLRRDEYRLVGRDSRDGFECHVAPLFHGHRLAEGARFAIHVAEEDQADGARSFEVSAEVVKGQTRNGGFPPAGSNLALRLLNGREEGDDRQGSLVDLTPAGLLPVEGSPDSHRRDIVGSFLPGYRRCLSLPSDGFGADDLYRHWEQIVLTPQQETVVQHLNLLHPGVREIAPIQSGTTGHHSFYARLDAIGGRVPLGSLGEGAGRLFGLSLALASSSGGILLIDEVESGLHFSSIPHAWEIILSAARDHDIQVFATTHSRDCVEALAMLRKQKEALVTDTLIHTIRRDSRETIIFEPHEFDSIVEDGLEVRR